MTRQGGSPPYLFTPARLRYPTLGFAGVLQFFTASFRGDRQEVELTVNGLYPGR